jgi:hypothetical protein
MGGRGVEIRERWVGMRMEIIDNGMLVFAK